MRPKGKPDPELYELRKEQLALLEDQRVASSIDIYYGDESQVAETGYVPYGWQLENEDIWIEAKRGKRLNCFGLISRKSVLHFATTTKKITANFVLDQLERFSWQITKPTVVILDNARIHTANKIKERLKCWQKRGLYIFYLPPYSPHLNICERLWKELKARWIKPEDYANDQTLFYSVKQILNAVGKELFINFSEFKVNSN